MTSWPEGRKTIQFLVDRGNLEQISGLSAAASAAAIIARASRRLLTAEGGLNLGDAEGAFAASYDAYRMAAEALLIRQGLRATGGEADFRTTSTHATLRAVLRPVERRDQLGRRGLGFVDRAERSRRGRSASVERSARLV